VGSGAVALQLPRHLRAAWRAARDAGHNYLSDKDVPCTRPANEIPRGETLANDTMLNARKAGKAR